MTKQDVINLCENEIQRLQVNIDGINPQHVLAREDRIRLEQTAKIKALVENL